MDRDSSPVLIRRCDAEAKVQIRVKIDTGCSMAPVTASGSGADSGKPDSMVFDGITDA